MNRPAAVARDVAQFLLGNHINPLEITAAQYDALNPPCRAVRMKIYFLTFGRAMKIVARHMERLKINATKTSVAPEVAKTPKRTGAKAVNEV